MSARTKTEPAILTHGRKARLTAFPRDEKQARLGLLKLRGVLILRAAKWGSKVATTTTLTRELRANGLKVSQRSLFHWQRRYIAFGFYGLLRHRRSDWHHPRAKVQGKYAQIVDAAVRVHKYADLAREYRKLKPGVSLETFRMWVRRIQRELTVAKLPGREGRRGLSF